jgi:hypothetical protein
LKAFRLQKGAQANLPSIESQLLHAFTVRSNAALMIAAANGVLHTGFMH